MIKNQISNFRYLVLASFFGASFVAEAQNYSSNRPNQSDVYVAGGCRDNAGNYTAMYYKNGQPGIPLMNGERGSATAIVVAGNDVYVAGDLDGKAVYWKNGQVVQLPSTALSPASAFSIAVVGNDVYVAGNGFKPFMNKYGYKGRDQLQPRYWKNGQEILLPQPPGPNGYEGEADANFIAVVDNDVYVIGRYGYYPIYWKNGIRVETINNQLQRVSAIAKLDGDIYAVGAYNKKAAYWKNGHTTVLTTEESIATAIAVAGNDVYVAGVTGSYDAKNLYPGYRNGGIGKYWKNGQPIELSGATSPYPTSIVATGNDVYVAGIDQDNMRVMLWKNGQPVELSNGKCRLDPWFVVSGTKNELNRMTVKSSIQKQEYNISLNPMEEADKFFAENKNKSGIISTASGLQYEIIKKGTGAKPTTTDRVKVNYRVTLINGDFVDGTTNSSEPFTLPLKAAIAGWAEGMQLMNVGSKYKFFIPSHLAYGDRGAGDKIKPGSSLIFEVELLEVIK